MRLRDVPLDERLRGFQKLVRDGMTEDEAQEVLALILAPGDKGGRIAA